MLSLEKFKIEHLAARMWITYSCDGNGATDQSTFVIGDAGIVITHQKILEY